MLQILMDFFMGLGRGGGVAALLVAAAIVALTAYDLVMNGEYFVFAPILAFLLTVLGVALLFTGGSEG